MGALIATSCGEAVEGATASPASNATQTNDDVTAAPSGTAGAALGGSSGRNESSAGAGGATSTPISALAGTGGGGSTSIPVAGSQAGAAGKAATVCDAAPADTTVDPAPTNGLPSLDIVLAPHREGDAVDYVDVTLKIETPDTSPGQPLLRLPMVFAGVESARYDSTDLMVEDEMGAVSLAQQDDPVDPTNFIYYRRWQPERATRGDVSVRYRSPTRTFVPVLGSGPPFDLRPEAGGIAGAGMSFLALPDVATVFHISVHWDLAAMPAATRGVFSRGEGDVAFNGPVELLAYAFYLAGPVSSYPPCPGAPGAFQAFWLSEPPFDMQSVAQWTERAYREISTFFHDPDKPYSVFFRHNAGGAIGGAALPNAFMVGYGDAPAPTPARLRSMLAHEIVHNWPSPLHDNASEWYGEGMAEHYSAAITLRAGLINPEEFLTGLNAQALSYYANPLRNLPSTEVAERFWTDTRVRNIPYDRGALYLATVDAAVRGKSMGMRSLDDLTFEMLDRLQGGQDYDSAAWSALLSRELGAEGPARYQAMIAGELIEPPGNAYGPCFSNEATMYPQFELGFDPAVLSKVPRVVTEVVPGSNAEQAGLRTGDEITAPIVLEDVLTEPAAQLTVKVRRGTDALDIQYVPRGAAVSGYRWTRVSGVPDSDCAL